MRTAIELTKYQYTLCALFSNESAKTQQDIEFGQITTAPRCVQEIARDNLIGKMAEAAVTKMLREEFGLHIPVNYEIYPRGDYDDNDIEINGWTIDIKATRNGRFLLLEKNKVDFRRRDGTLPDVIIMCQVPWNKETDVPRSMSVTLVGCISTPKLLSPNSAEVLRLKSGEYIPGTFCRLQANNYAVNFDDLTDIKTAVKYMLKHKAPRKSNDEATSN